MTTIKFSAAALGFFMPEIHGDAIPPDAVDISSAQHAALLEGQAAGLIIAADQAGRPILAPPVPPSAELLAAAARAKRDALLRDSDWTDLPNARLSEQQRAAWAAYRDALFDLPAQPGFPTDIAWPAPPAGSAS